MNFFSCRKVSNILSMQTLHNTLLLIFFISDLIRDEKICILLSTYFSTLMRSDMVLTSDFDFPFVTSTTFSMCFAVDVETTHSKRILSFFALLSLMNGTIKFFELFLFIFFKDGRTTTVNAAHFGLLLFWSKEIYEHVNISLQKRTPFFKNKRLFLHYKCCTYHNISFFLPSRWNWLV